MFGGRRSIVEAGFSKGVDGDAGTQWFLVVEALNWMLQSLYFMRIKRHIFLVGELSVLIHDLLSIKIIKIQNKVTDFFLIFLRIKVHLIGELRGQFADL